MVPALPDLDALPVAQFGYRFGREILVPCDDAAQELVGMSGVRHQDGAFAMTRICIGLESVCLNRGRGDLAPTLWEIVYVILGRGDLAPTKGICVVGGRGDLAPREIVGIWEIGTVGEDDDRVHVVGHHDEAVYFDASKSIGDFETLVGDDPSDWREIHFRVFDTAEDAKFAFDTDGDETRPGARIVAVTQANAFAPREIESVHVEQSYN